MAISNPIPVVWSTKYNATSSELTMLCVWRNYATGLGWAKIQLTDASNVELGNYTSCVNPTPKGEFYYYTKIVKTGVTVAPTSVKLKTYKCSSETAQTCVAPIGCTTPTLVSSIVTTPTTYSATVYTAPQGLMARVGDTFSVVSWTYPTTGIPLIYQVRYYPTIDPTKAINVYVLWSNTVVALTNLANNTEYTVEVRAISASGVVGTVSSIKMTPASCPVCPTCPPEENRLIKIGIAVAALGAGYIVGKKL